MTPACTIAKVNIVNHVNIDESLNRIDPRPLIGSHFISIAAAACKRPGEITTNEEAAASSVRACYERGANQGTCN